MSSNLAELADRVEAGDMSKGLHYDIETALVDSWTWIDPRLLEGSLDAAKALHDAVLPGWWWTVTHNGMVNVFTSNYTCDTTEYRDGTEEFRVLSGASAMGDADNPAAAWVVAILRAKDSQDEGL